MRHRYISWLLLAGLGLLWIPSVLAKPVNVLFFYSDDHAPGALGALGHPDVKTPHLDALYRDGFHFSQAYNMGSMVMPVCLPSRAMLMSGKSLFRAPNQLEGGPILPEVFRQGGYTTFVSGKWHNGAASLIRGFDEGEAVFLGAAAGTHYGTPVSRLSDGRMISVDPGGKHSSELFAESVIGFLKKQTNAAKPFFCYLPFTAPHTPHESPAEFQALYDPARLRLPENFRLSERGSGPRAGVRGRAAGPGGGINRGTRGPPAGGGAGFASEEAARRGYAKYYAIITHMDQQIGRVLQTLKETGQAENTLIVFASDHGYSLGNHGLGGKNNLYEHGSRAMICFSGPAIPRAKSSDALVYLFDLFSTLCELTELPKPPGLEGASLVPVMKGEQTKVRDTLFTAMMDTQRAVRNDRWKLLQHLPEGRVELFDLLADPAELRNLADQAEHRPVRTNLEAALETARAQYGDTPEAAARLQRSSGPGGTRGRGGLRGGFPRGAF